LLSCLVVRIVWAVFLCTPTKYSSKQRFLKKARKNF
jgi:hypothetical protein